MPRLLIYTRNMACPDQALAWQCLKEWGIASIEINVSRDPAAAQILRELVGSLSVPTIVIADEHDEPIEPPKPIGVDRITRNVDRGSIISEPNRGGLSAFLVKHGLRPS